MNQLEQRFETAMVNVAIKSHDYPEMLEDFIGLLGDAQAKWESFA